MAASEVSLAITPTVAATPTPAPTPQVVQLFNVSTRVPVRTSDEVGIGGFTIQPTGPQPLSIILPNPGPRKRVVVRALGPSLKSNGVPVAGALQDPTLELYNGSGTLIAANDKLEDYSGIGNHRFGLAPADDRESAIIADLYTGQYTAVVRGFGGTTGISFVEVYDLDGDATVPLVNISTRGKVETGENVLIAGVITRGADPVRFLFRAIGPELSKNGVFGALANTTLQLFDANGTSLAFNDDWKESQRQRLPTPGSLPRTTASQRSWQSFPLEAAPSCFAVRMPPLAWLLLRRIIWIPRRNREMRGDIFSARAGLIETERAFVTRQP